MTDYKPLTKEITNWTDDEGDDISYYSDPGKCVRLDDVRSALEGLKQDLLRRHRRFEIRPSSVSESHMREIETVIEYIDEWFPVFNTDSTEPKSI